MQKRVQIISFFALFLLVASVVTAMWWPYLQLLFLAVILSILFSPVHQRIRQKVNGESWAAVISVVLMVLIVILPISILSTFLFNELVGLYNSFRAGDIVFNQQEVLHKLPASIQPMVQNLGQDLSEAFSMFSANTFNTVTRVASNVAGFFVSFFLLLFSVFFLLRDGGKIKNIFIDLFPLSDVHEKELFTKVEISINGIVTGQLLTALTQGSVATIGFFIFGVPQPLLWGAFTVLAALVPTVGTSLSIIPAVLYLVLVGKIGAAVGMGVWGILAVGLIDNFIGPKIIGSQTKLHPLLVLFSILGGVQLFGFLGILLGPIIMAILVALVEMYRNDLKDYLES